MATRPRLPPQPQPVSPRIDDPLELLLACHGQIRRFAALALRLRDHVAASGADAQAREAAAAVLRYFDLAAPLHHADEEDDLFPALQAGAAPGLQAAVAELAAAHAVLDQSWQALRPWLAAVVDGRAGPVPQALEAFVQAYLAHADREEAEVFPHARGLPPQRLRELAARMAQRRTPSS